MIGLQKLRLRPKDWSPSRLFIYLNFSSPFSWFYPISNNVSVWLWNFKDGWSWKVRFLAKNQHTQMKKCSVDEWQFVKKSQNPTFKVDVWCQKSTDFFFHFLSFKNINLGEHFLLKTFFSSLKFSTTLFCKICPIFTFIDGWMCNSTTELIITISHIWKHEFYC